MLLFLRLPFLSIIQQRLTNYRWIPPRPLGTNRSRPTMQSNSARYQLDSTSSNADIRSPLFQEISAAKIAQRLAQSSFLPAYPVPTLLQSSIWSNMRSKTNGNGYPCKASNCSKTAFRTHFSIWAEKLLQAASTPVVEAASRYLLGMPTQSS